MTGPNRDRVFSDIEYPGIILGMCPANQRRCYIVTSSLIGWAHTQKDPMIFSPHKKKKKIKKQQQLILNKNLVYA